MKSLFAVRLSEYKKELGINKRQFAEKTGVSPMSVSDLTSGKIPPDGESFYLICGIYNVSADYLLGSED